jgi:hypothetical protein
MAKRLPEGNISILFRSLLEDFLARYLTPATNATFENTSGNRFVKTAQNLLASTEKIAL